METRFNDAIHRIYYMLKLNTMIILGILCGGCVLTALTVGISEHYRAKGVSTLLSFKNWWKQFIIEIKVTGIISWVYNLLSLFLLWALWFTSQFKGLIFFSAWLIQLSLLFSTLLAMMAESQLRQYYEGNWRDLFKLSWIQIFMTPRANFYTFGLWIIMSIVGYQFPAISAFWCFGIWISYTSEIYTKEWRRLEII